MMKRLLCLCALFVCGALVGCDKASSAASAAAGAGGDLLTKARDEAMKQFDLTKIEEAIGKLTGDAKTGATTKLTELKGIIDQMKASTTLEAFNGLKDKAMKLLDEIKKMVGM